jgi:hypothetical protein
MHGWSFAAKGGQAAAAAHAGNQLARPPDGKGLLVDAKQAGAQGIHL